MSVTHNKSNTFSELFPSAANFNSNPPCPRPEEKINNAAEMMTNDSPPKQELNDNNTGVRWAKQYDPVCSARLSGEKNSGEKWLFCGSNSWRRRRAVSRNKRGLLPMPLINCCSTLEVSTAEFNQYRYKMPLIIRTCRCFFSFFLLPGGSVLAELQQALTLHNP